MTYQTSWFHSAHIPPFQSQMYHCKTTKNWEMLFLLSGFHLSSCYPRTHGHQVELMGQSLLCCDVFDTKQVSCYPEKGTQWFGMIKMVQWIFTPNLVINTYDCLLHRLSIFCLSFLPKYPMPQAKSQARVKRRENTILRKQAVNE